MATALARQLAQIAATSRSSLNVKTHKAAHSRSLLWDPAVAAAQSFETVHAAACDGLEDLRRLDSRFDPFAQTLFSDQSQREDRSQLTAAENANLDRAVEAFLRLVGPRLRLMPAIKALEWLIRRFRIHEHNTTALITAFIPYHTIPAFVTLLSILPPRLPVEYQFLAPYARSLQSPPRSVIVHWAIQSRAFLESLSENVLETCRTGLQHSTLVSFWAGVATEAVAGLLDRNRSGRQAIQAANDQALIHRLGPVLGKALAMKQAPGLQVAAYMPLAVLVAKGGLEDDAIAAFMDQLVHGWTAETAETARAGLVCLAIMAQHRSGPGPNSSGSHRHHHRRLVSAKVAKALLRVVNVAELLAETGRQHQVDKLAYGFGLALVDRLSRKGDSQAVPVLTSLLTSCEVLQDKQAAAIVKALLVAAHRLDDSVDAAGADGSLQRALGAAVGSIQKSDARGLLEQTVKDVGFDIEELEMELDVAFEFADEDLPAKDTETAAPAATAPPPPVGVTLAAAVEDVIHRLSAAEVGLLSPGLTASHPGALFAELSRIFVSAVSLRTDAPTLLSKFAQIGNLDQAEAFKTYTYFGFLIRIWCGPFPALARAASLELCIERIKSDDVTARPDPQLLIPYCLAALFDPSPRVRRVGVRLLSLMAKTYDQGSKTTPPPAAAALYGQPAEGLVLTAEVAAKLFNLVLLPSAEESIMHEDHISAVIQTWIDDAKYRAAKSQNTEMKQAGKDHTLGRADRLQIFSFLCAHAVHTPLLVVKERLLRPLNDIRAVSSTTRTQLLLPALRWWAGLSSKDATELCARDGVGESTMDTCLVQVTLPTDRDGLGCLLDITKTPATVELRTDLIAAVFVRLQKMWPSMRADVKSWLAQEMLSLSQAAAGGLAATEAAGLLHSSELTTDILASFLDCINAEARALVEPPSGKRRRAGKSSDASDGHATQTTEGARSTLHKVTFVLQLVEGSEPSRHPQLFAALFDTLAELQKLRTAVGSELGYLQNLVLRSLLTITSTWRAGGGVGAVGGGGGGGGGGYGDLLVSCVQKSSSSGVQSTALLLIARLASTAPELVLHSVMPIFTFMGASVLRQSDDYSAHVVNQTIQEVVPPLMASLRRGQRSPVAGAAELLVSFTTAYEHMPPHRREAMFLSLVEALGPAEFLFAIVAMLVDRYRAEGHILKFSAELFGRFSAEIQLESVVKLADLVRDIFARGGGGVSVAKSRPSGLPTVLLDLSSSGDTNEYEAAAAVTAASRQLAGLPVFLAGKTLRARFERLAKSTDGDDNMEALKLRDLYAALLEKTLQLSDGIKDKKTLQTLCGATLASLLNLLEVAEFIKAVEGLLDRPDPTLRQRVLRVVELRVDRETGRDGSARAALLAFLPHLTALIRESSETGYKRAAVECVAKIGQKYGRRDLEAVAAAAAAIASGHCLGQSSDRSLRVASLICLGSLVEVLGDAAVAVLPAIVQPTFAHLRASLGGAEPDSELHGAGYAVVAALAGGLPWMLPPYLAELLQISSLSAESGLDLTANERRVGCLHLLAERVDPKELFTALETAWPAASAAGFLSVAEYLHLLRLAVEHHSKSAVAKNVTALAAIIMSALDLRRQVFLRDDLDPAASRQLDDAEQKINEVALKVVYKLDDATFRPVFARLVEWASEGEGAVRTCRRHSVYGFLSAFFAGLKSIVTSYATYVIEDATAALRDADLGTPAGCELWRRVLAVLAKCFEHDRDEFWQSPAHFGAVAPVLVEQVRRLDAEMPVAGEEGDAVRQHLGPAIVRLASAADSAPHRRELNTGLLRHLRSERAAVRRAAVQCQLVLVEGLGEEWLAALPEMLPYIGEVQDDDDEDVAREGQRWIVRIEGVLGESLDSMLQ